MENNKLAVAGFLVLICMTFAVAATVPPKQNGGNHIQTVSRNLPRVAHYVTDSAVVLIDDNVWGEASTQSLSETTDGWVSPGTRLTPASVVYSGALVNTGTESITIVVFGPDPSPEGAGDFNGVVILQPGENIVVTEFANQYKKTCICQCGSGWVSVGNNPPCSQFNGQGPCIDPTCHRVVNSGFSNCKIGWGPQESAGAESTPNASD